MINKKINFIKLGILLFSVSILILNCQKDDFDYSETKIQTNNLDYILEEINYSQFILNKEIQNKFSGSQNKYVYRNNNIKLNKDLTISVKKINKITSDETISWTFKIQKNILDNSLYENFLVKKFNNKLSYFLVSYQNNNKKALLYPLSGDKIDFSGTTLLTRTDTFDVAGEEDNDFGSGSGGPCEGIIHTEVEACDQGGRHTVKYCCQHYGSPHGCNNFGPCNNYCSGTNKVTVIDFSHCNNGGSDPAPNGPSNNLNEPNDTQNNGSGGTSNNNQGNLTITAPVLIQNINCPPFSGKIFVDGNCGCPDSTKEDNNGVCIEDDKIDASELTGKAECLNDRLTKNGNTFVKDLLANFNGNSEFDINISSKDKVFRSKTTIEINGKTIYKPGTTLINIHISTNQMSNRNSLSCIRTLLHEYIHADMYRKLNTSKKPTGGDIDFKQTYNDFDNNNFKASPQHETMAKLYIGEMKNALKEAHNKLIPNEVKYYKENYPSNTLDDIYEALAWQGLKEHKVKAWLDKGNDTININKTINTKLSGLTKEFCK